MLLGKTVGQDAVQAPLEHLGEDQDGDREHQEPPPVRSQGGQSPAPERHEPAEDVGGEEHQRASITAYSESQRAKSAGGCRNVWRKVMVEPSTRCHSSISPSSRMKKPTARTTSEAGERPAARRRRQRTRQRARAIAS